MKLCDGLRMVDGLFGSMGDVVVFEAGKALNFDHSYGGILRA